MKTFFRWSIVMGVAIVVAVSVAVEHGRVVRGRAELEVQKEKQRMQAMLEAENRRLRAAQVSADELARLAQARRELPELRMKVAALSAKLSEPEPTAEKRAAMVDQWPATEWKNAGRATPQATTETALWAATGGEVDVLAQALVFDERGREAAERLLAGLSDASRAAYGTPERLIALLAAKDVPAGAVTARVSDVVDVSPDETRLRVRLEDANGATKSARLRLRRATDGWRMVVSERAVTKYAETLSGAGEPMSVRVQTTP